MGRRAQVGLKEPAVGVQRREKLPGCGGFELDMKLGISRDKEGRYSKPGEHGGQGPQVKITTACVLRFGQRGQKESDMTRVEDQMKQDLKDTTLREKSWSLRSLDSHHLWRCGSYFLMGNKVPEPLPSSLAGVCPRGLPAPFPPPLGADSTCGKVATLAESLN